MLTALSNQNRPCYAWEAENTDGPFICKECRKEVTLRKGPVRIHHFAHKPPVTCQCGKGETELHHIAKKAIFEALKNNPNCSYCELEYKINDIIPDVYAVINNVPVAIEVQRSKMNLQDVYDRTVARHKNGLSVIWIVPSMDLLKIFREHELNMSRVPKWMAALHTLAYGRIYVWSGDGDSVIPVHFKKVYRHIPYDEFHDSEGEYRYVGEYDRLYRDRKVVIPAPQGSICIGTNFHASNIKEFSTKTYKVPACSIWHDSLKKWWNDEDIVVFDHDSEHFSDIIHDERQDDTMSYTPRKWFKEGEHQVEPDLLKAFGVTISSRYGYAYELSEMLEFVHAVAWDGLESYLESVFYDSKASVCTFEFAPGFDIHGPEGRIMLSHAHKHFSQFIWGSDWHHSELDMPDYEVVDD